MLLDLIPDEVTLMIIMIIIIPVIPTYWDFFGTLKFGNVDELVTFLRRVRIFLYYCLSSTLVIADNITHTQSLIDFLTLINWLDVNCLAEPGVGFFRRLPSIIIINITIFASCTPLARVIVVFCITRHRGRHFPFTYSIITMAAQYRDVDDGIEVRV